MFGESLIKKSVKKFYGDNALSINSNTQVFSDKECIIESKIDTLLFDKTYNFPLRKFVNGRLMTLPKNIRILNIGTGSRGLFSCNFNQSLDYLHDGLEKLVLNSSVFNQPLDNLPLTLKELKINCNQIKNIDVNYLANLTKLESYTSNFVSVPKSVTHLILNNSSQILDLDCSVSILEINQLKLRTLFSRGFNNIDTLGSIPDSVEHLIIKSIKDYTLFQRLPNGISTIQIPELFLKDCQDFMDNLPSSLSLIKISVNKILFDFISNLRNELEKIEKNSEYNKIVQRVYEIYDIISQVKLPFGCDFKFCLD
jgi:hypothetical protein